MIRNMVLVILQVLMFISTTVQAQYGLKHCLEGGVESLESATDKPLVIAVGSFTYAGYDVGSMFSRYLEENLGVLLSESDVFDVFERNELKQILQSQQLSLSDLVDPTTAPEMGKLRGMQAILNGMYFDAGDSVEVILKLISIETGTVMLHNRLAIAKSAIPVALRLLPENYDDALLVKEELRDILNAEKGNLVVKVWTTRGNGATYRDGEELVVNFLSNMDCFVKIFHVDAMKKMQLIFPNEYHTSNSISRGQLYGIPDGSYPFKWVLAPPYGTEFIKVVASTTQFEDIEAAFTDLGAASRQVIERGMRVEKREGISSESLLTYTVVK